MNATWPRSCAHSNAQRPSCCAMKTGSMMSCCEPSSANWISARRAINTSEAGLGEAHASAFFGVLDPHDAGGEEDTGNRQCQHRVRLIAIVDGDRRIDPPDHRAHEPDKGKIPHSHRGYLNEYCSQCVNSGPIRYFGNPEQNHRFGPRVILDPFAVMFFQAFA